MCQRQGFSLIEVLIYLLVASCCMLLVFQFFNHTLMYSTQKRKQSTACATMAYVHDLIAKDIMQAAATESNWSLKEKEVVFQMHEVSVGWRLKKGILQRLVGTYDFTAHAWHKKNKSVVAYHVQDFLIELLAQQHRVQSVLITLSLQGTTKEKNHSWHLPVSNKIYRIEA